MDNFPYQIRPIDPEKDAESIADLVMKCFRPWLEIDNINYLHQLRDAGTDALAHPFLTKITGFPYKLPGIVCTDNSGSIIGLLNTYQFFHKGNKCCLISNVCVEASHRKEGIASHLLSEAEKKQRAESVYGLYLQARMENQETFRLYKHSEFSVTDFRETWIKPSVGKNTECDVPEFQTEIVPYSDREVFQKNFQTRYPATIIWNLDYSDELFRFGKINALYKLLTSSTNRFQKIITNNRETKAWSAFQQLDSLYDQLWFVPEENAAGSEQSRILTMLCSQYKGKKALKLDVPASESDDIFKNAGFFKQQTLAWMWKRL